MRTLSAWLGRLYFGVGLVLGVVLFASQTMHAVMAAPPTDELIREAGSATVRGGLRILFWAPSLYERVVKVGINPVNWLIY